MLKLINLSIFIFIYLFKIVHNKLIVQPTDTIILRDRYKPFIALCTGQENIRVVSWRSPLNIDIEENNHQRITVERKSSGLRLRIRNLTEDDQGIWKCVGFDQYEQSIFTNLKINLKIPITFLSESIQYVELNSTALIKCRVNANPFAEISWFKGRDKINLNSPNYEQQNDGLKIHRVLSIDNDIFWCQADVIETGESKDYQIQVIIAQSISSVKVTCLTPCAVEKRTATLICEANGRPTAEYSWSYEQNIPFIVDGISKFIVRGNRLIINHVDETDNGRYVCHAFNNYDKIGQKKEYSLNVIIPPVVSPIPQIEVNMNENSLSQRVSFSCRLQRGSIQNLSLQWFYSNCTLIQPNNEISIDNSNSLSELIFNPVQREHHGNYTCIAKNSADITSVIARLYIQYKPVYVGPANSDVYSVVGHHVIMKCQFDSYPTPIIQWIKIYDENNELILDDTHFQVVQILTKQISSTIYETELTYEPLKNDFNLKFKCQADNSRIEQHYLTLRQAKIPGKTIIPIIKPGSNSIELVVKPPSDNGGLPLLEYIVKYEQIQLPNSTKINSYSVSSNESQSISIEDLRAATLYRIQIVVKSQAGEGPYSAPVQAMTTSGNISQFNLANNSCLIKTCLIQWFIKNDGGSSISKVEIHHAKIFRNGKEDKWIKSNQIDGQTTEYELTKLKPNTNYSIIVRLFNAAGYSEQKIQKTTNVAAPCKGFCSPKIWIIVTIVASIIIGAIAVFVLLIHLTKCQTTEAKEEED